MIQDCGQDLESELGKFTTQNKKAAAVFISSNHNITKFQLTTLTKIISFLLQVATFFMSLGMILKDGQVTIASKLFL